MWTGAKGPQAVWSKDQADVECEWFRVNPPLPL